MTLFFRVVELQARRAIEPISFSLARSERIVLHSPPGLGKSILLHSLAGPTRLAQDKSQSSGKDIHELEASDLDTFAPQDGVSTGRGAADE